MKKWGKRLLVGLVWASVIGLVVVVWNAGLIAIPQLFYSALIGLLILSALFSSAETAFTILQEDVTKVAADKASGRNPDAKTKLEVWSEKQSTPSKFFRFRYGLIENNLDEAGFLTLLPFLLVMTNLINLGGMYLIGRGLTTDPASAKLSLVISGVIVVVCGEVVAKLVAYRLPVWTASSTVLFIAPLKFLLGWYTSCLIVPIEAFLHWFLK